MRTKQIVAIVVVLLFALSVAGISYAGSGKAPKPPKAANVHGTVTLIEGTQVTTVNELGVVSTTTVTKTRNKKQILPGIVGINVGDLVEIKGVIIEKQALPVAP